MPSKVLNRPSSASIKRTLNECNFNSATTCDNMNSSSANATPSVLYNSESATPISNNQNKSRATSTCSIRSNISNDIKLKKATAEPSKDYTTEMFNNFERKTFSKGLGDSP